MGQLDASLGPGLASQGKDRPATWCFPLSHQAMPQLLVLQLPLTSNQLPNGQGRNPNYGHYTDPTPTLAPVMSHAATLTPATLSWSPQAYPQPRTTLCSLGLCPVADLLAFPGPLMPAFRALVLAKPGFGPWGALEVEAVVWDQGECLFSV